MCMYTFPALHFLIFFFFFLNYHMQQQLLLFLNVQKIVLSSFALLNNISSAEKNIFSLITGTFAYYLVICLLFSFQFY